MKTKLPIGFPLAILLLCATFVYAVNYTFSGGVTGTVAANGLLKATGRSTVASSSVLDDGTTLSTTDALNVTSASATSFAVGLTGASNSAFLVDSSTASQAAGFKITGAATGGTVALVATDSGSNTNLTFNAKGSGTIGIGTVSTGAVTITPALTITGAATPTGGIAAAGGFSASPRNIWVGQTAPMAAADFNNSTPVITETYVSEVFVPCNMTITGIALFNGSDVTGNVTVALATSAGTTLSTAKSASTAGSGTDAMQRIPFAVAYAAVGPAIYYIQVQYSSATARYNTHILGNHGVLVQTSQTYGTMTNFTPPTTFVTNVSNVAALY